MKPYDYYQVELEVCLPASDLIFGFINISHIPYAKLSEIFQAQMVELQHSFLFQDGVYMIDEKLYRINKAYLDKEIPFCFDFHLFEYYVHFSGCYKENYQQNYHQGLPPDWGQVG